MANESVAASSRFSGAHSFVTLAHLVMEQVQRIKKWLQYVSPQSQKLRPALQVKTRWTSIRWWL